MKKTIAFIGEESSFLLRLLDYVNKKGEVEAFICRNKEETERKIKKRKPSVVFYMEDFLEELPPGIEKVAFLKETNRKEGIYQYQSAGNLYKEMRRYIWKEIPQRICEKEDKKIYAVYSPLGRSGKTSFACAYARANSFFYLGLEEYGIETNDFCSCGGLLYHIKNRRKDVASFLLQNAEEQDGILIFGSPAQYVDVRWLDDEDFGWFLDGLRKEKRMPSIIIDLGSNCVGDFGIFEHFDQIFIPILSGETEERKLWQFKELLYEANGKMEGKVKEIMVPNLLWKLPDFLDRVQYMEGLTYE